MAAALSVAALGDDREDRALTLVSSTLKPLRSVPSISDAHTAGWRWGGRRVGGSVGVCVYVCVCCGGGGGGGCPNFYNPRPTSAPSAPITVRPEYALPPHWRGWMSVRLLQWAGVGGKGNGVGGMKQLESYGEPSANEKRRSDGIQRCRRFIGANFD